MPSGLHPLTPPKVRAVAIVQARIVMAEPQGFLPPPACNKKKREMPYKKREMPCKKRDLSQKPWDWWKNFNIGVKILGLVEFLHVELTYISCSPLSQQLFEQCTIPRNIFQLHDGCDLVACIF